MEWNRKLWIIINNYYPNDVGIIIILSTCGKTMFAKQQRYNMNI